MRIRHNKSGSQYVQIAVKVAPADHLMLKNAAELTGLPVAALLRKGGCNFALDEIERLRETWRYDSD